MRARCLVVPLTLSFIVNAAVCQKVPPAAPPVAPSISGVTQFLQQGAVANGSNPQYMLRITGTGLPTTGPPQVILFPTTTTPKATSFSATEVDVSFSAIPAYSLQQVVLSYLDANVNLSYSIPNPVTCDFIKDITSTFQVISERQVTYDFGRGVSRNFEVIEISIVNQCALPVIVPLAGITIDTQVHHPELISQKKVAPTTLAHVTSVYTVDRQYTGKRAKFFNTLSAAVTIGSAVEPFLASGFTQGVSIAGGGLTTGAQKIWVDMSAQQLQNLASESFGTTEQLAATNGTLKKFLFIPIDTTRPNIRGIHFVAFPTSAGGASLSLPK